MWTVAKSICPSISDDLPFSCLIYAKRFNHIIIKIMENKLQCL